MQVKTMDFNPHDGTPVASPVFSLAFTRYASVALRFLRWRTLPVMAAAFKQGVV